MTAPIRLPPLGAEEQTELRQRYEEPDNPETRTRYQMILLAQRGQTAPQIARLVLRSEDTVERVLRRFFTKYILSACLKHQNHHSMHMPFSTLTVSLSSWLSSH